MRAAERAILVLLNIVVSPAGLLAWMCLPRSRSIKAAFYSEVLLLKVLNRRGALDLTGPGNRFEFPAKLLELLGAHVADGAQIEAFLRPEIDVDSLHGRDPCGALRVRSLCDEQIDEMAAAAVHDRRDRFPEHVV